MTNLKLRLNEYLQTLISIDTYNYNHNIINRNQNVIDKLIMKLALTFSIQSV